MECLVAVLLEMPASLLAGCQRGLRQLQSVTMKYTGANMTKKRLGTAETD